MAFLEQRLSDEASRGSRGGPMATRTKVYSTSRRLYQNFPTSRPLQVYDYTFGNKLQADFEALRAMFYVVFGTPYTGFRWKDWNDYKLTQSNSTLVFITGSTWQIYRRYSLAGGVYWDRIIQKPNDDIVVKRTRSGVVTTATATVATTTGIATISGHAGGDTYTCEGTFDVPVTFADNEALANVELDGLSESEIQGLPSIRLEEILL